MRETLQAPSSAADAGPRARVARAAEGSAYSTWRSNVVTSIHGSKWLHLWTHTIHDVLVADNFADTSVFLNKGTRCPMVNNTIFAPGAPPPAAKAIMEAAGVRSWSRHA